MKLSAIVEALVIAGATPEMILSAVRAAEQQQADALEKRREHDRNRQAAKRERDASRDVTLCHSDRSLVRGGDARGEDITSNSEISGQEEKTKTIAPKAREGDLVAFKDELSDLDPERIEAIVKHRRSKRGQLTGLSARLFRQDAAACGLSLADAVDTCISRNWITVKPEYLTGRQQRATAPPKAKTIGQMFIDDAKRMGIIPDEDEPPDATTGRMETSNGSGQGGSPGIARRFAIPADILGKIG